MYTHIHLLFLSDDGPTLEKLDCTIRIGSTPTFLYFDLYLYYAYTAHYVYKQKRLTRIWKIRRMTSLTL